MADPRFFTRKGPFTVAELAKATGATLYPQNTDNARAVEDVAPLNTATTFHVSFLDNPKYVDAFKESKADACFVHPKYKEKAPAGMVLLLSEQPYTAYALAAQQFYPTETVIAGISPKASIAASATIGAETRIDDFVVIEDNVVIGARCHIGPGAHIAQGVTIGDDTRLGANSTLSHSVVGSRVLIHRSVHIGQDGFGFAPSKMGIVKVPQLGRVIIEDDVEIGSGTCVDRGAGPDTFIGAHTKIDNHVQIGHNCYIGRYVIISGQSGISGTTRIEDGVMLGGGVGTAGHLTIGKGAKIAGRSGIMTDVPEGATFGGAPAVPIRDWHRQTAAIRKLATKDKSEA